MDGYEVIRMRRDNGCYVNFVISANDEVILGTFIDHSREVPLILQEDFGKSREAILEEYSLYGFEPYT
jgi:hypothetical protein